MIKSKRFIYWALMCTFMAIITIVCGITITESSKVATLTLDQTVTYNAPTNIPVTLDANGGSFGGSPSREVIIKLSDVLGSSDILSNLPTRTGYTLSGWKYSKDNITFYTYDSNTEFPFTDHLYLQAQWTISTYTVTMLRNNDNYGTISPSSSLTIGYDASISISGNTITFGATDGNVATTITATPSSATGYTTTFTSWDNISGTITANRSITATFTRTANTYSITYAGMDGATHGEYHPTSATYGTPFTVSNPTKAGYSFTGWNISNMDTVSHTYGESSSSSTTLSSVTATTFSNLRSTSGTVTFTATWTEAVGNYTVTFTQTSTTMSTYDRMDNDSYMQNLSTSSSDNLLDESFTYISGAGPGVAPNMHVTLYYQIGDGDTPEGGADWTNSGFEHNLPSSWLSLSAAGGSIEVPAGKRLFLSWAYYTRWALRTCDIQITGGGDSFSMGYSGGVRSPYYVSKVINSNIDFTVSINVTIDYD